MAERYGIRVVPYHIIIDGKDYLTTQIDKNLLYSRLKEKENLPTSSAPSEAEFLQIFAELSQKAETILHISTAPAFGAAYSIALKAKEAAREKLPKTTIEVIDSRTTSSALGLIVLEAAKAATQGKEVKEIMKLLGYMIPRTSMLSSRDTLFYLDKGGRIFEAKAWAEAEAVASFRAIVEGDASTGGVIKPVTRAKTKTQILNKLVDIAKERVKHRKLHAAILHNKAPDLAEQLREKVLSQFHCDELYVNEGSPIVALYNGEGLIELSFYSSA
jgi:DegV family protein with EDD domain